MKPKVRMHLLKKILSGWDGLLFCRQHHSETRIKFGRGVIFLRLVVVRVFLEAKLGRSWDVCYGVFADLSQRLKAPKEGRSLTSASWYTTSSMLNYLDIILYCWREVIFRNLVKNYSLEHHYWIEAYLFPNVIIRFEMSMVAPPAWIIEGRPIKQ